MSGVQSINRAFQLLEHLVDRPATVSELVRRTGLANTTVTRILKTLLSLGVVARDDRGQYLLGDTARRLSEAATSVGADVRSIDQARLYALTAQLGEVTGVSVRQGTNVHYITQVASPQEVQVRDWTGELAPLHVVSSGLVFLAYGSADETDEYLSRDLHRFTPHTQTDQTATRNRLATVRDDGIIWTNEEFHLGINSVAAPIFDSEHQVVAALHCHGPSYRFPQPGQELAVSATLKYAASTLSHSIGWRAQARTA